MSAQERRLVAVAAASASAFRNSDYHLVRAEDVAERVRLPRGGSGGEEQGRSAVWLYNEVKSRRVLVSLALKHTFDEFAGDESPPSVPDSVSGASALVTAALDRIARFHQVERFLVTQVRLGIGDISTSEKRSSAASPLPLWPDGPFGRVAAAGWEGRISAYTAFLAPRLAAAARAVALPREGWAEECAARLSDLAFRALADDPEGPVGAQAAALAAHWFSRDLVPLAGGWIDALRAAEGGIGIAGRNGDLRVRAGALTLATRVLLDNTPLLARAASVSGELGATLETITETDPSTGDARALCDATSRHGLALLRYGDLRAATGRFERSRRAAEVLAADADSYVARAEHNMAEALAEGGRPGEGLRLLDRVLEVRSAGAATSGDTAPWRRLTITQQTRARTVTRAGQVVRGLLLAEETLRDRQDRLGHDNVNTTSAQVTVAEALIAAGQPIEARRHLLEAHMRHLRLLAPQGYWLQHDIVRLAQVELLAGFPGEALRILSPAVVMSEWFAENVSPRLHAEAVVLRADALSASGSPDAALTALTALTALDALDGPVRPPLVDDFDAIRRAAERARAGALLRAGAAAEAAATLETLALLEAGVDDDLPGRAETLLLSARAARALHRPEEAGRAVAALPGTAEAGLDDRHPVVLAGRMESALLLLEAGRIDEVHRELAPLLDREPLAHGRPALGDGHPLLAEARALADRLGTRQAPGVSGERLWDDPL
ncbi:hypothetical protein [Streptosporangium sp. NPDC051022]|uniref:hypothetical protein n=1 Tax=Streptosporangium sp. NPDC051022 TaxID=3155752 RepID=UPI00342C3229